MLERSHEAERLNAELGEQNAQLLLENAALRARDSRPASAPGGRRLFTSPAVPCFLPALVYRRHRHHCDPGRLGVLNAPAALMAVAGLPSCAALTRSQAITGQRSNR
jgi:hypothetical protein